MANRRKRSNRNFVAIPFSVAVSLGTLGDGSVADLEALPTLTEDLFVMSVDMSASVEGLTAGQLVPADVGYSHGDYSVTQVKEKLDVVLTGPGSKLQQERVRRLIRKAGAMNAFDTSAKTESTMIGRNGSRIVRTKINFVIQSGKPLNVWIHNRSGAQLTTGSTLRTSGTVYGRWIL